MLYKTRKPSAMTLGGFRSGTGKCLMLACTIKKRLEKELGKLISSMDKTFSLGKISPLLIKSIREFVLRNGKRIRPLLFIIGYLGFAKRPASGLYRSALSMELLHDFMLIHDDIIDKSATRRGEPSMHALLNNYLKGSSHLKFSGEDLAIVLGDVVYAIAINAFLSIKEDPCRKEKALKKFVEAAMYTGTGEFIELLCGAKELGRIKKEEIYQVYDFKTAYYSFASPLAIGSILAGAKQEQVDKIFRYGVSLGRAFQIKDDIISMFDTEKKTGKPSLTDLQEGKKTLLVWYAWQNSSAKERSIIKRIFAKKLINKADFLAMRKIITDSGALDSTKREIKILTEEAQVYNSASGIKPKYRKLLNKYCTQILAF
ncbi:MAG: polyprenyl synthetase family protein [bacterium]